jgi:hypothetical protein
VLLHAVQEELLPFETGLPAGSGSACKPPRCGQLLLQAPAMALTERLEGLLQQHLAQACLQLDQLLRRQEIAAQAAAERRQLQAASALLRD